MNKLAHKMDLEAEALRVKYAHKKAKKAGTKNFFPSFAERSFFFFFFLRPRFVHD